MACKTKQGATQASTSDLILAKCMQTCQLLSNSPHISLATPTIMQRLSLSNKNLEKINYSFELLHVD